ncbi:MAG: hypothetical protein QXT86_08830 [Archaeoglobaceae archaeon]
MSDIKVKQPYVVSVNLSRTVNLGNYESLKLGVSISIPFYDVCRIKEVEELALAEAISFIDENIEVLKERYRSVEVSGIEELDDE